MSLGDKKDKSSGIHRKLSSSDDDSSDEAETVMNHGDGGKTQHEAMEVDMIGGKKVQSKGIRKNKTNGRAMMIEQKKAAKRAIKSGL